MEKVKPISPSQALSLQVEAFPQEMIQAVNNLIQSTVYDSYDGFRISAKDIETEFSKLTNDKYTHEEIYQKHWMDFEDVFRNAGWKVTYTKADYTENWFQPYYNFKIKKVD